MKSIKRNLLIVLILLNGILCAQDFQFYLSPGYTICNAPLYDFNEFVGLYNKDPRKLNNYVFEHGFDEIKSLHGFYIGGGILYKDELILEINHTSKFNSTFAYYNPKNNPTYLRVDLGIGVYTTELLLMGRKKMDKFSFGAGLGIGFLNRKLYYWDDDILQIEPKKKDYDEWFSSKTLSIQPTMQFGYKPLNYIPMEIIARVYYQAMMSRMYLDSLSGFRGYWTSTEAKEKYVTCGNLGITFALVFTLPDFSKIKLPKREPKPIEILPMQLKGQVIDSASQKPVEAVLTFYKDNRPVNSFISTEGNYVWNDCPEGTYQVEIKAFGYKTKTETIKINEQNSREIIQNFKLAKMDLGEAIKLENILFEKASAKLLAESNTELDKLVHFLLINPGVEIEISGHTSSEGNDDYNKKLSQDRANSISDYLVSKGIEKRRITAKGYGETRPVASNDTEEGRKLNRRVEFKILKQ